MSDLGAVSEVLEGFTPIGDEVPAAFAEFVADRVAARPSPTRHQPQVDPFAEINEKLDEILTILRGGSQ